MRAVGGRRVIRSTGIQRGEATLARMCTTTSVKLHNYREKGPRYYSHNMDVDCMGNVDSHDASIAVLAYGLQRKLPFVVPACKAFGLVVTETKTEVQVQGNGTGNW